MSNQFNESTLFEALNAKKLSPTEIAASFVVPPQFDQLVSPDHAFLVGPRGSGKTTLLRMRQGEALMSWGDSTAPMYRNRIRYSSIFLPADRIWASQVPGQDPGNLFGIAAFTTQMLYALVETMLYRLRLYSEIKDVHHPAEMTNSSQVELVTECATAWKLKIRSESLLGLQGALDLRLNELGNAIEMGFDLNVVGEEWLKLSPIESLRFGIRSFNRHAGQPDHRWALLLDEMELAPMPVHLAIRDSLRGSERNLILKLSFSPFDRFAVSSFGPGAATPDNDFKPIYLWYGTKVGGRKFTRELWNRIMEDSTGIILPPRDVLGTSEIDVSGHGWRDNGYQPNSVQLKLLMKMRDIDDDFAQYLKRSEVDLNDLSGLSYSKRSSTLRKIYPLLVYRDALLDFKDGKVARRKPRKKLPECFSGVDAVFAALEGNPRWLKAVLSKLIIAFDQSGKVDGGIQFDMLEEAAVRFESLLRLLPVSSGESKLSVLDLLNDIASYFSARAFGRFTADPPSSFKVDELVPQRVAEALSIALASGAIVHLRRKSSPVVLPSLFEERFRLAYLLCLRDGFEIPLRLGKEINLSTILNWADLERTKKDKPPAYVGNIKLFDIEDL